MLNSTQRTRTEAWVARAVTCACSANREGVEWATPIRRPATVQAVSQCKNPLGQGVLGALRDALADRESAALLRGAALEIASRGLAVSGGGGGRGAVETAMWRGSTAMPR
ncbi:unnamed protein product [Lampetra planeri]